MVLHFVVPNWRLKVLDLGQADDADLVASVDAEAALAGGMGDCRMADAFD